MFSRLFRGNRLPTIRFSAALFQQPLELGLFKAARQRKRLKDLDRCRDKLLGTLKAPALELSLDARLKLRCQREFHDLKYNAAGS